jgi:hypothetical protein
MDDSLQGLEIALDMLEGLKNSDEIDPEILENLLILGNLVLEELNAHDEQISQSKFEYGHDQSPELFEIAKKYCTLHAAAACLHTWLYNRSILGEFFARGEWLLLSLHRLLRTLRPLPYTLSEVYVENVAQELLKLYQKNQHFSIVPFQLAHSQTTEEKTHELQLQS